ncbi:MAG: geranylgeranylglyceryl/heptaprenylglyceryl phosphate synthase [Candidatus Bathyarchaeia archaeon]|jgi:phosphoglycerol geranylgeranyltransferase|nr:geranylgeranylglyceryl/heptaprenylglyceryl phosphate synthase [Candidatus Bathyarchaeota archaeon A05DMB-4]MDH7595879.1 geranylgeranylglyceryl/heptaprenylglyceryl phosphate synthase [Candidatus Bathyarchaeota archaeon]
MIGKVEKYLLDRIRRDGAVHLTLIDPEKVTTASATQTALTVEKFDTTAIMIGGSTSMSTTHLDKVIKAIKKTTKLPVILFPNNVTGISKYADAIWFLSLINSLDPYFLIGAQILGAPIVKKYRLEAIPLGYIIVGEGGAAGIVGRAATIPYDKPELAVAHALAAQYLGMRFIYLEGGSGASKPVPPEMIRMVKSQLSIPLIVGGGIRTGEQVKKVVDAGAELVVTGTVIEQNNSTNKIQELIENVKKHQKTTVA